MATDRHSGPTFGTNVKRILTELWPSVQAQALPDESAMRGIKGRPHPAIIQRVVYCSMFLERRTILK